MKTKHLGICIILVLCIFTFFVNNGILHSDIMEARNIVTAREMVYDGHWIVPTMNGEIRIAKPPLPTWIAGAVEKICPNNIAAQRLMPALAATMLVLFFILFALKISNGDIRFAFISALLLLTCYNIVQIGRLATWDIYCHAFMMSAIYFLFCALTERKKLLRNMIITGILFGLSFLSKGPVSFYALLLPFIVVLPCLNRIEMKGRWWSFVVMLVIFMAVSSWWYIYIMLEHPTLAMVAWHKESSAWAGHNVRPWYYYWNFFTETGVWTVLMLTTLAIPFWLHRIKNKKLYLFAISWTFAQLFLLSLMPEKKTRYLVPMMIPCCLSMGCVVNHWVKGKMDKVSNVLFNINVVTLIIVVLLISVLLFFLWDKDLMSLALFIISEIVMAEISIIIFSAMYKKNAFNMVGGIAVLFLFVESALMPSFGRIFSNPNRKSIALTQNDKRLVGMPFYHNDKECIQIEEVYAANRKILPMNFCKSSVVRHLPCVIVTEKYAGQELSHEIIADVDTTFIGRFDDNNRWKLQKHRGRNFVYYVTLLKHKIK